MALTLALHTAARGIASFEVYLCPAPAYSDPVGFSSAEMTRLARPEGSRTLERDGRRWLPTRELLEKVVVDRPSGLLDLVLIGTGPSRRCSTLLLDQLRPGGHVFVQDRADQDLLDRVQFRHVGPDGRLLVRLTGPDAAAVRRGDAPKGPTLAELVDRAGLIESHYPLARALARRMRRGESELADLEQVAFAALVRAAGRYDPGQNTAFASFAAVSVAGELKRYFRDKTWALRVPRSLQETYLRVKAARDELAQQLGASPTVPQIADHLGISEETVLSAMEAGDNYRPASLDAPGRGEDGGGIEVPSIDGAFDRRLDLQLLAQALPHLDAVQHVIIQKVFFEAHTQRQVAGELGVSQMQISRLLARALVSLRQAMGVATP